MRSSGGGTGIATPVAVTGGANGGGYVFMW